jgi:LCP family protein required for cell wall assembly
MGFVIVFFLIIFVCIRLYRISRQYSIQTGITPQVLSQLIFGRGVPLQSTNNRVNILILGIAGGTHEGPDLTDTMIIASVSNTTPSVALISIPRDIWSDTLQDKINSAYHYGEEKKIGGGKTLAKAITEDVTGLVIHYVVVVDFSQFQRLIDVVGGIDVIVPTAFVDTQYPIAGKENDECGGDSTYVCRYETIQFQSGLQHMDGTTALKYVRSRHAEGDDGTDFARGKRQQDVIVALKNKIMQRQPWFHPTLARQLVQIADTATDTDMTIGEQLTMGKQFLNIQSQSISKISIEPLLINPPEWMYGRYVLVPEKDFQTMHDFITKSLQN